MASKISKGEFVCYFTSLSILIVLFLLIFLTHLKDPGTGIRYSFETNYQIYKAVLIGLIILFLVLCLSLLIRWRTETGE